MAEILPVVCVSIGEFLFVTELACDNSERYGVDKDALLQHMIDSLSPGEDGYILLGHISR